MEVRWDMVDQVVEEVDFKEDPEDMTEVAVAEAAVGVMVTKVLAGAVSIKVAEEDTSIMEVEVEAMEEKKFKIQYLCLGYLKM